MTYFAATKDAAERIAANLTGQRAGLPAAAGSGRTVTRYIVDRYATPNGRFRHNDYNHEWGVVERWVYDDRPDLPEFGGAFAWLSLELLAA